MAMNETCMNDYDTDTYEVVQPPASWKGNKEKTPEPFKQAEAGEDRGEKEAKGSRCVGVAAVGLVLLLVSVLLLLLACVTLIAFLWVQVRQLELEVELLQGEVGEVNTSSSTQSSAVETLLYDLLDLTADNLTAEMTRKIEETSSELRLELDLIAQEVLENITILRSRLSSLEGVAGELRNLTVEMVAMIRLLDTRLGGAQEEVRLLGRELNATAASVAAVRAKVEVVEALVSSVNLSLSSEISVWQETFSASLQDVSDFHSSRLNAVNDSIAQNLSSAWNVLGRHDDRLFNVTLDVGRAIVRISSNENAQQVLMWRIDQVQLDSISRYNHLVNETSQLREVSVQSYANLTNMISEVLSNSTSEDLKAGQVIDGVRHSVSYLELLSELYTSHVFASCEEVQRLFPNYPPGFYRVISYHNGTSLADITNCNFYRTTCGNVTGNWRRIGYYNSYDSSLCCPASLSSHSDIYSELCGCVSVRSGCSVARYNPQGLGYSKVCGMVTGYQVGNFPRGFTSNYYGLIHHNYLDGVSITYGQPSLHLWSYANGYCGNCTYGKPAFVSNHFNCDGPDDYRSLHRLWEEGGGCRGGASSWFVRQLNSSSTDDVYVRVCDSFLQGSPTFAVDRIEVYVSD